MANKIAIDDHKESFMRKAYHHHRSSGWRPLHGIEDQNLEWVTNALIPQLKRETGLDWKSVGSNLLHSSECQIFLPEYTGSDKDFWKEVRKHNPAINSIKKLYSVVELEEIGYFLNDTSGCNDTNLWQYLGFWALGTDNILKRGSIMGQKFGL